MADDKIIIEIELDDGSIQKGFLKVEKSAEDSGRKIGDNLGKGLSSFSAGKLLAVGATIVAAFKGVTGTFDLLGDAIRGAAAEADSINRLNTALSLTGKFSQETAQGLLDFSNNIQATTKFANDAVLEVSALIQTLGRLDEQGLKQATKSALDLSTALGIDVNTAATLVGKAANGNVEAFKRYGIEIQKGKTDAETFANALKTLESRFGGASEAASQTFTGSLTKLSNVFGDVLENIGFAVTQSPALISLFNSVSRVLQSVGESIQKSIGGKDILKPIIIGILDLAQAITSVLGPAFEIGFQFGQKFFSALITGAQTLLVGFLGMGSVIESIFNKVFGTTFTGVTEAAKTSLEVLNESAAKTALELGEPFSTALSDGAIATINTLRESVASTNGELTSLTANMTNGLPAAAAAAAPGVEGFKFQLGVVKTAVVDVSNTIKNGIANAATQGISAMVKAIRTGQNALSAFGKAILGVFGDMAIQIGQTLLVAGLGLSALFELSGPKAIIAGIALIAVGTILKSLAGGEGGGAPVAGQPGGGGAPQASTSEFPDAQGPAKPQNQIAVNIQGDVLDSSDTGLRIVDILRTFADKNGDVVTA